MRTRSVVSACALVAAAVVVATAAHAAEPALVTLFDFEQGVEGWWGNPWGGGKCAPAAVTPGKFGQGALQATYTDIGQGGNVICPYLPADAAWRGGDYDRICFWLKGDGSASYLHLYLACEEGDNAPTYTVQIPLDSTRWRRFCYKFDTFWTRQNRPFDLRSLRRLYFGTTGTHQVLIDQIALQRPLRPVPLAPADNGGPAAITPELAASRDGYYFLTFDPGAVLEPTVTAELTVQWPGRRPQQLRKTFAAQAATEELWLALPGMPDAEGEGRLTLRLTEPSGNLCYSGPFTFRVALAIGALEPTALQLVPRPKQVTYHPGSFRLPLKLQAHVLSQPDLALPVMRQLQDDLRQWFGCRLQYQPEKLYPGPVAVLVITAPREPPLVPQELSERFRELREQGYALQVDERGLLLAARDAAGLRYAATTLLQVLRSASPCAAQPQAPHLTIMDWPSLPFRAVNICLPTTRWGYPNDSPVPMDYFLDYLRRTVVDQKINAVGLEIRQGMRFDKHPELAGPAAYSKQEVRRLVEFLRGRGVEVFPLIEALGHAEWLVIPRPELQEDGDTHTLCTRHPAAREVLRDCFDEALELFEPQYIHFGLDEIRWQTDKVAQEKRCPRCRGLDKRRLFVEQVQWLAEYARARRVKMLMWADMVLREHNGGPPYQLADTLGDLPRDVIMCDWSTTLAPASLAQLSRRGFTVVKSNSCGVNNAQVPFVLGNMWGIWAKTPWLTEANWDVQEYCYLRQLVAAEYSWNVYPDLMADGTPCPPEYFPRRPLVQQRLAARPEPAGDAALTALQPGSATVPAAGLKLPLLAEPLLQAGSLEVRRPAAAAYCLVAADGPAGAEAEQTRTKFLEAFRLKENWQGVPVGELQFTLTDGSRYRQPLLYGTHLRAVGPQEAQPQVLEALATVPVGPRLAYLLQWVNPKPRVALETMSFVPGETAMRPVLLAVSVRAVRPDAVED